jgi:hypothetical protein
MDAEVKYTVLDLYKTKSAVAAEEDRVLDLICLVGKDTGGNIIVTAPKPVVWSTPIGDAMENSGTILFQIPAITGLVGITGAKLLSSAALVEDGASAANIATIYAETTRGIYIAFTGIEYSQGLLLDSNDQVVVEGDYVKAMNVQLTVGQV